MHFLCSVLTVFCALLHCCVSSGYFELQMVSMTNTRGELSNGQCCGVYVGPVERHACRGECDTFFHVCLKQYQSLVTYGGHCTFGNASTHVLGGNSFMYSTNSSLATIKLPFQFSWTVSVLCSYTQGKKDMQPERDPSSVLLIIVQTFIVR